MPQTRDSISDIWGPGTPYDNDWPIRVDERTSDIPDQWIQSACVLCSNGCALDIGVKDGRIVGVRGRGNDRVNHGRLGPKGLHGWQANHSDSRLTRPLIRRGNHFHEVSWDEAMGIIVQRSKDIRDRHTSSAIGFYTSGQLFLEEYYTLAVIGKAGLGTPHMDEIPGSARRLQVRLSRSPSGPMASRGPIRISIRRMPYSVLDITWLSIQTRAVDTGARRRQGPNRPRLSSWIHVRCLRH